MGFISDHSSIREAFVMPLICQVYVLYFALSGHKPVLAGQPFGSSAEPRAKVGT
jgi:fucose permease